MEEETLAFRSVTGKDKDEEARDRRSRPSPMNERRRVVGVYACITRDRDACRGACRKQ